MPGARSVLPKRYPRKHKRIGAISKEEKALVADVLANTPGELSTGQVTALATTLRRSKEAVKALIEDAKENFQSKAKRYSEIHIEAAEKALEAGTEKSLAVAVSASQWAMENLSAEGVSIVGKKQDNAPQGGKIMIGIQIGGLKGEPAPITPTTAIIDAEKI